MSKVDKQKIQELLTRGVEEVIVKDELEKKLLSGQKLKVYLGIDPTGTILHLGHAVILRKLRDLQQMGHDVILLIGDFTAKIGDPTDKSAMRKVLTDKEIKENFKDYKKQASKILDFTKVRVKYNSAWLSKLKFADILELTSQFTVQQMLHREMFDKRMKDNAPISITEFMYPLMQGYDSVVMDVDLEIGGNDQLFNMLAGRELQKKKSKSVMATKLLLGTDGKKMSKSFGNFIALNDKPNDMFGKIMSVKDELINEYFELATELSLGEISKMKSTFNNPRDIKAKLAKEIVKMYYGEKEAVKAEEEFNKVHRDKEMPTDMPIFETDKSNYAVLDLLCDSKLVLSKNDAKRLIEQNAVEVINGENKNKVSGWKQELVLENEMIIKVGGRRFIKIRIK